MNSVDVKSDTIAQGDAAKAALFLKIGWRLLPILIICYIVAFLDRINIGFAQLQMKQTLHFSDEAYALGAGIFFIGYMLLEVPSNLMLEKIGARKTLLRIMFCWGVCTMAIMFVQTQTQFLVLRFLVGAFEAGFFPGIILYLTYWYPRARRGSVIAMFMTATSITNLIAGPVSGTIMAHMDGFLGQYGWQWLFVMEGFPAVFLGIFAYFYLDDTPAGARWLTSGEKELVRIELSNEMGSVPTASHLSMKDLLRDPSIYLLALVCALLLGSIYSMLFWIPTLIRSWGVADVFKVGLLSSLGPLCGIVGCVLIGRSSDRHRERRWHFLFCVTLAATGLLITINFQGNLIVSLFGLCVLILGQASAPPLFFAAASAYLPKATTAAGIAMVNSLGSLGPAFLPFVTTRINSITGTPITSMYIILSLFLLSGVILAIVLRPKGDPQPVLASEGSS